MIKNIVNNSRNFFLTGETLEYNFRLSNLRKLKKILKDSETEICEALFKDLNKSSFESYMCEIGMVLVEINYMIKNLKKFMKNKKVRTPLAQFKSKSFTSYTPYGVALIMSPWNYPFMLSMTPLVASIAAGNTSIIKPSNYSFHTSTLIHKIISENFDSKYISVILGGREENQRLLDEKFDFIFFTGSEKVGKIVMEKASLNLTPIILELGGKSPCIVSKSANLKLAAKRIAFGKLLNAGQTCIAPDYIYIDESVKDDFLIHLKKVLKDSLLDESNFPKIINSNHHKRLLSLLENEHIIYGGEYDATHISPTILDDITFESKIMQEEIFGPLIPILTYQDENEMINTLKVMNHPLALYLFTTDKNLEKKVLKNIIFGGGCINDTIIHLATSNMGFGGVGNSGMGSYHGKESFEAFSHKRSIVKKSNMIDLNMRYRPYTKKKENLIRKFLK